MRAMLWVGYRSSNTPPRVGPWVVANPVTFWGILQIENPVANLQGSA